MITFLTLFLGLFSGVHTVELAVEPPATRVELLVDGRPAGFALRPPYRFRVDFGGDLTPHRLTAIGRDAEGAEVARTSRDVNLIPREAGLEIAFEMEAADRPRAVHLQWRSVDRAPPERLELWLDGEPLIPAPDAGAVPEVVPLPELDLADIHFVTADLYFPNGWAARAERVFGGERGREIGADNTPVAVEVEGRRRLRRRDQAAGLIEVDGAPAQVLAIEHGAADVVIVRERSAFGELAALAAALQETHFGSLAFGRWADDRFFLVAPAPRLFFARQADEALYPVSPALPGEQGNLIYWLATEPYDPESSARQDLAQAVAMAGMLAASAARPRTVLLATGPEAPPIEPAEAAGVRRFLERLQVPLTVWYVQRSPGDLSRRERVAVQQRREAAAKAGEPPPPSRDELLAAARAAWGEAVVDVDALGDLTDATRELRDGVARQRILWIDGDYLPTAVSLAPGAPARLAGGAE